jgi:hypothetical protein
VGAGDGTWTARKSLPASRGYTTSQAGTEHTLLGLAVAKTFTEGTFTLRGQEKAD